MDIDSQSYNLDPSGIESAVQSDTSAVVATHLYGNPCDIEVIGQIANKNNLKVVYDAAHSFGVQYKNKNILNYGDASVLSFHATKIFHTVEGGAVIFKRQANYDRARKMINFGINLNHKTEVISHGL